MIFGEKDVTSRYLLGGSGDDFIQGNNKSGTSKLWGGDGDDIIDFGSRATVSQNVWGGKGDDFIGVQNHFNEEADEWRIIGHYSYDEDADYFQRNKAEDATFAGTGRPNNEVENLYGEQGDDIIFGGRSVNTKQNIHGGSGDD